MESNSETKKFKIDWANTIVWSSILLITVTLWSFVISLFL
jgi:hypothetical protein